MNKLLVEQLLARFGHARLANAKTSRGRDGRRAGEQGDGRSILPEELEGRRLLSGTVSLQADGTLSYSGTDAAESVYFQDLGDGQLEVVENKRVIAAVPTAAVTNVRAYGSGGNDEITHSQSLAYLPFVLDGGPGDDLLTAAIGALYGGDGNDRLSGAGGDNYAAQLYGGPGADTLANGVALYTDRAEPLSLTADGRANDGAAGEHDNLLNVGGIYGGQADDYLHGGATPAYLSGGAGNDVLYGGAASDSLYGDDGNDQLHGGRGNDYLSGGLGEDALFGEGGDDEFFAYDGTHDFLAGGHGNDYAQADTRDEIVNVEAVYVYQ